jgi:hypothetical protein
MEGSRSRGKSASTGTSVNDVLLAVIVVGGLIGLTILLVEHYSNTKDVTSVLGVVAPVLAAAVGARVGYSGGSAQGQARGSAGKNEAIRSARKDLAQQLEPWIGELEQRTTTKILDEITTGMPSPAGKRTYSLAGGGQLSARGLTFADADIAGTREAVAQLRGAINAVLAE